MAVAREPEAAGVDIMTGKITDEDIRRMNLIDILAEEYEDVQEPPEDAYKSWSEQQIKSYFTSGGTEVPPTQTSKLSHTHATKEYPPVSDEVFESWFPGLTRSGTKISSGKKPYLRVLCFTPAGSSEDMYTNEGVGKRRQESPLLAWCRQNESEVYAIQLPGRGKREREQRIKSAQEIAKILLPIIYKAILSDDVPYVTLSHSVGTFVQFELMSLIRDEGLKVPVHCFVSSFPSPDIEESRRPWKVNAQLNDDQFKVECRDWDTNEVIFSKAVWPGLEPLMRADFTIFDQYKFTRADDGPFDIPITAFWAKKDKKVTKDMVARWETFTTCQFTLHTIDAHHLFPISVPEAKKAWLEKVVERLQNLQ